MADPLDTLIDHAADLQQQVNQIAREVMLLALAGLLLALAVALIGVRTWRTP